MTDLQEALKREILDRFIEKNASKFEKDIINKFDLLHGIGRKFEAEQDFAVTYSGNKEEFTRQFDHALSYLATLGLLKEEKVPTPRPNRYMSHDYQNQQMRWVHYD